MSNSSRKTLRDFCLRFDSADALYKKVKDEYPNKEVILTGHSLGSAEAIYVGVKNNTKSISFNEGTSPLDVIFSQFGNKEINKKQTVYITAKDIVSNLSILEPYNIKYVPGENDLNFVSHSLNYFLPKKDALLLPDYLKPKYYSFKPKKYIKENYADLNNKYGIEYFKDLMKKG